MVNEQKVEQMIAFFLERACSRLSQTYLMSLLYLADRATFKQTHKTISGDCFVATPASPVLYNTMLRMINGGGTQGWGDLLLEDEGDLMGLQHALRRQHLSLLRDSELTILLQTWQDYATLTEVELGHYVRSNCDEWTNTLKESHSSLPISTNALFTAFGWTAPTDKRIPL